MPSPPLPAAPVAMLARPDFAAVSDDDADAGGRRQALCDTLRRLAADGGAPAYLVGGPVRDLLLGVPVHDLDITVAGDAIALAQRLAGATGGRLTAHRRFGSATVALDGAAVDLVSARRETYPRPGALPVVSPGAIADDLARRDFTINAMALPISGAAGIDGAVRPTELIDPHGGRADLAAGVVRILHPHSFRDDPTRILRAVRYAGRFSFNIADDTLAQLRAALAGGAMSTISGDRIRHELERILAEPAPLPALRSAGALGALSAIHPALDASHLPADAGAAPLPPLTLLAMLVWPLPPEAGASLAARLNAPTPWRRVIGDAARCAARLPRLAVPGLPPSAVCALLDGIADPALDAAPRLLPPSDPTAVIIGRYRAEWRSVAPLLRGDDLLRLGVPAGPAVGEALRALRQARLDGAVRSRQDEKRLARRWTPA